MKNNTLSQFVFIVVVSWLLTCCQTNESEINSLNQCYQQTLDDFKKSKVYVDIIRDFNDTINILKSNSTYFNEKVNDYKIDEAIFMSSDSLKCLAVLLIKNKSNNLFGKARVFLSTKEDMDWKFRMGHQLLFDEEYFQLYQINSFENISLLARYYVLTDGDHHSLCRIDEKYWFVEAFRE